MGLQAIDFDKLVECLRDLKAGWVSSCIRSSSEPATKTYGYDRKRAEIPIYSFEKHARVDKTTAIYSPHVLVVEGIFALHDARVLELLDMKVRTPHVLFKIDLC